MLLSPLTLVPSFPLSFYFLLFSYIHFIPFPEIIYFSLSLPHLFVFFLHPPRFQVKMLRPKESLSDWFNIMVVHQNRAKRGPSNYLPESFLDPFLDLIIWGHEHDCIKEPWCSSQKFHIMQPGMLCVGGWFSV